MCERYTKKGFIAFCAATYGVNIAGHLLLAHGELFFRFLYHLLTIPTALLILLFLPAMGLGRQLRIRLGMGRQAGLFLGLALSPALVSLIVFWFSRFLGFLPHSVGGVLLAASAAMYYFGRENPLPTATRYEEPLHTRRERRIFISLTAIYLFLLLLAFIQIGTVTWQGVAIPAIGDWINIYADISAITATGVPPQNPFINSGELSYYYLFHLYSALYVMLSGGGISVQVAGALGMAIAAVSVMCGFFCVARQWLRSFAGALAAMLLITFIGGWDIIGNTIVRISGEAWPLDIDYWTRWTVFKIHSPVTGFHFLPQHMFGVLFSWLFFYFATLHEKGKWPWCILALAGSLGFSSWTVIGTAPSLGLYLLLLLFLWHKAHHWRTALRRLCSLTARFALTAAVAVMATLPIYLKAFGGSYGSGSPIRCWRFPPLSAVAWLPVEYVSPTILVRILGVALMEILEFGPVLLLGIPGILLLRRLRDRRAACMLLAVFCVNFFLINSMNAGGTNPGECVSKIEGIFVWWAFAIFAGLFLRERYGLSGSSTIISPGKERQMPARIIGGAIILACALGFSSTLYSVAAKMNPDRLPVDDFLAFTYIREKLPIEARVQRSPCHGDWSIPAWGRRLTSFSTPWSAWEYLVPVEYVWRVRDDLENAFQSDNVAYAHGVFRHYETDYILLGEFEKKRYSPDALQKFFHAPEFFSPAWSYRGMDIIKVLEQDGNNG